MPSQKMRLEAEMRDNASPAIRKLRQELADLQAQTSEVRGIAKLNKEITQLRKESGEFRSTAGMKAFNAWMAEAKGHATGFTSSIKEIPGILGAVGIGSIAAGASVAGLAEEMKKLGEQSLALKELSREVGMSADFVNRWSHAGAHFAVTGDAMKGMLDRFAGQLPDFNRGVGGMFKEFSIWPDVVRRMRSESPADALLDALRQIEEVGRVKGPQVQKQLLDSMGLGGDAEKLFGDGGLAGLLKQLNKPWTMPSQDLTKQAMALRDATSQFNNAVTGLENTIGPDFLKGMTTGIHGLEVAVEGLETAFKWLHDFATKSGSDWDKAHNPGGRFGMAPSSKVPAPDGAQSLMPRNRETPPSYQYRRNDGHSLYHKSSYDGSGFGGLLQNASYVTGGTGSGTMTGAVSEGARTGVLQAFREAMLEQDLKGGMGLGGGGDAGGGGAGGRRGFMQRGSGGNGLGPDTGAFPAGSSLEEVRQYIRAKASALGIDPNIAERVARSEGLNKSLGAGGDGGTSDGPFQLHIGGGLGDIYERKYHHSIHDKRYWRDQVDFALGQARQGGWAPWHGWRGAPNAGIGIRPDSTALDALRKRGVGDPETANGGASYPGHIGGRLSIEGENYRFGSGGVRGSASIPLGDYPITPGAIGAWGQANGALGINGNKIWDKTLGRMRQGIEMHAGHSADLITEGCLAFEQSQFPKLKAHVLDMIRRKGHAYLHVGQDGASITPDRQASGLAGGVHPHAGRRATGLNEAARGSRETSSDHRLTIDLRDPGDHVKATRIERNGPLQVDMQNKWRTHRAPLIGA